MFGYIGYRFHLGAGAGEAPVQHLASRLAAAPPVPILPPDPIPLERPRGVVRAKGGVRRMLVHVMADVLWFTDFEEGLRPLLG